ncbi:MAG: hypothetical protein H7331_04900 [Bacteroidia bacterium]|nr:hypothetical protein [Bacteroidia bacterium]
MKITKTIFKSTFLLLVLISLQAKAQEKSSAEKFGKTLNLGAGLGYYGYLGSPSFMGTINYEFDIAKNFTLAPFIGFYSYQREYYWVNNKYPNGYYSYKTTVIPIGVKGTYYFDQLLNAGQKWDFYLAGSVGFSYRRTVWENGYYGDVNEGSYARPLYLNAHVGAEYHLASKVGLFLDLSTGVSTFGLAIHL